jgi:glycosyltransferase involved in cell wall biosynthesis
VLRRHDGFFAPSTKRTVIRAPLLRMDGASEHPPHESVVTLGYLGSLSRAKGVHLLLAAAAEITRHGVLLRIAGDGPLRSQVEAAEHVRYEGRLTGSARDSFLLSCDAGVVPSVWEEPGLTFVVSEWLAAGRPVVASARGGLAEAGPRGGVMAVEPSATALADAVAQLRDQDRWRRLRASVPAVEDTADIERWVDEHEAAYAAAAGLARAPES